MTTVSKIEINAGALRQSDQLRPPWPVRTLTGSVRTAAWCAGGGRWVTAVEVLYTTGHTEVFPVDQVLPVLREGQPATAGVRLGGRYMCTDERARGPVTVTEIGWVTVLVRVDVTGDAWAVYPDDLVLLREARP